MGRASRHRVAMRPPWRHSCGRPRMAAKTRKRRPWRKRRVRTKRDRLGICPDSLQQIRPDHTYDLVIIDQSEKVFGHLFSDTITTRGNQDRIYKTLCDVVRRARHVVALD